jgi:ring-1,2-phenylacetyl-CoA epoxidase subunit PaaD
MSDEARAKLRAFGLAPPRPHGGLVELELDAPVPCPRCGSPDTILRNAFGSALCREIRGCRACGETFERFKPL